MIKSVSAYELTCDGCPATRLERFAAATIPDFVRSLGWWCGETATSRAGFVQWEILCPTCRPSEEKTP